MIRTVECSVCSASFPVDPRKVPEEGVYARCSACDGVFFVEGGMTVAPASPQSTGAGESRSGAAPSYAPAPEADDSAAEAATAEQADDWVFETEPEVDPSSVHVDLLDTVEEGLRKAQDDASSWVEPATEMAPPPPPEPEPAPAASSPVGFEAPAPPPPAPPTPVKGFTFGRRDPHEKASRLARVLVSDIITYKPERHQRALDGGTLKQDFEDEIEKSWGEYVDQVGNDLAESTNYFNDALNEILARGEQVF